MKRKLLLTFLTLSICNLCVASEESHVEETTPLLPQISPSRGFSPNVLQGIHCGSVQFQRISQHVTVDTLQYPLPPNVNFMSQIPLKPKHLTLDHLNELNKTDWEKWIKTYGVPSSPWYSMAIDSAAEYAKKHASEWDDFRKKIVDDPRSIYKFCHSGTMKNRIAFFQTVDYRMIERQRNIELQQLISGLQQQISTLTTRLDSQLAVKSPSIEDVEGSSGSKSVLESRLEALEQRLKEETEKREALEREIEELKAQKTVEAASVTVAPESDHTEFDMTKVSETFTSQIEELRKQFEELKASIGSEDDGLTGKIQSLSEKIDAMDFEGIRADVEKLAKEFSEYKEGAISPDQFDAFTIVLLALRKLADPNAIDVAEAEIKKQTGWKQ